jgi:hypothetical protein
LCRQSATVCLIKSPSPVTRELSVLTDRLTALPGPRDRRGRRHSLVAVLLTAACAVLAGARSYPAIGQWARHAPQHTHARLGIRAPAPPPGPRPGSHPAGGGALRRPPAPATPRAPGWPAPVLLSRPGVVVVAPRPGARASWRLGGRLRGRVIPEAPFAVVRPCAGWVR